MSDKKYAAEGQQFGQAMNSIAYSETMMAAVRDYKKVLSCHLVLPRSYTAFKHLGYRCPDFNTSHACNGCVCVVFCPIKGYM